MQQSQGSEFPDHLLTRTVGELEESIKAAWNDFLRETRALPTYDSPLRTPQQGNHPSRTYRVELELQTKDAPTVQHWQQPQGKNSWALRWKGHTGTKKDVEVDGEGIQFIAQSGTHWPAVLRGRYSSRPFYRSPQGWWLRGHWLGAQ